MSYKKPEVVAKSEVKQSFVGGCPVEKPQNGSICCCVNTRCMCGPLK